MKHWRKFERKWLHSLLKASLPSLPEIDFKGIEHENLDLFYERFEKNTAPFAKFGLRATVWAMSLLPVLNLRYLHTFRKLPPEAQFRFLKSTGSSNIFFVRMMPLYLKVLASMAYFSNPENRKKFEQMGNELTSSTNSRALEGT